VNQASRNFKLEPPTYHGRLHEIFVIKVHFHLEGFKGVVKRVFDAISVKAGRGGEPAAERAYNQSPRGHDEQRLVPVGIGGHAGLLANVEREGLGFGPDGRKLLGKGWASGAGVERC
jgi:hypothetical protein